MDSIYLTGYLGCGKTVIASILSKKLQWAWMDTDTEMKLKTGMPMYILYMNFGESGYQLWEAELIKRKIEEMEKSGEPWVIACGCGIPDRQENIDRLKARKNVVFLESSLETLFERVKDDITRPGAFPQESADREKQFAMFQEQYEDRLPGYKEMADVTIQTDGKTPEQIADEIIEALNLK